MSDPDVSGEGQLDGAAADQLSLTGVPATAARRKRSRAKATEPVADELPVARVLVDIGLPHLDHSFDYLVPASMSEDAVPGARVAVRFAGADHAGFIAERIAESDHDGRLARVRRVVSAEPVLTPELAQLARAVADRYAGTVADVLRLAIPPRHATTERKESPPRAAPPSRPDPGDWAAHRDGGSLLEALADGGSPRAVWTPGPGADWPDMVARLVVATLAGSRGAVVVAPDRYDVAAIEAALTGLVGAGHHVVLEAESGPAKRYGRWLAAHRGSARAVVGTRAAAFAPVERLGLVCVWDDGDDLHAEPRAPYPHAREVLLLRAHQSGSAAVVGGFARTAEAELLLTTGWARPVAPDRAAVRAATPVIRTTGDDHEQARDEAARRARLPTAAWRVARAGLVRGPVLVQVPRAGYLPAVVCVRCRTPARCETCTGALTLDGADNHPRCPSCESTYPGWRCPDCGHRELRAGAVGVGRTAEELGRTFPGVAVLLSRGERRHDDVGNEPALVVATPGAEPAAVGGYAAALLLDGTAVLARPGLRTAEEALRRWLRAATLVRPSHDGGEVVVVANASAPAVQALVRWDPAGFATRELAERASLRLPPVARVARLNGTGSDVSDLLAHASLPDGVEVLGPASVGNPVPNGVADDVQVLIRVPRSDGAALAAALRAAAGVRSARRSGAVVRIQVDPLDVG